MKKAVRITVLIAALAAIGTGVLGWFDSREKELALELKKTNQQVVQVVKKGGQTNSVLFQKKKTIEEQLADIEKEAKELQKVELELRRAINDFLVFEKEFGTKSDQVEYDEKWCDEELPRYLELLEAFERLNGTQIEQWVAFARQFNPMVTADISEELRSSLGRYADVDYSNIIMLFSASPNITSVENFKVEVFNGVLNLMRQKFETIAEKMSFLEKFRLLSLKISNLVGKNPSLSTISSQYQGRLKTVVSQLQSLFERLDRAKVDIEKEDKKLRDYMNRRMITINN